MQAQDWGGHVRPLAPAAVGGRSVVFIMKMAAPCTVMKIEWEGKLFSNGMRRTGGFILHCTGRSMLNWRTNTGGLTPLLLSERLTKSLPVHSIQQGPRPSSNLHRHPRPLHPLPSHHQVRRRNPPRPLLPLGSPRTRLLLRLRCPPSRIPSLSPSMRHLPFHRTDSLPRIGGCYSYHGRAGRDGK